MSIYKHDYETGEVTETHQGCVLELHQRDLYDTDWCKWALVWNGTGTEGVTYWTSHPGQRNTDRNYAVVDATPEVLEAFKELRRAQHAKHEADMIEAERYAVRVGKVVKVVRGRKIAKGTIATVVWMGPDRFSKYGGERVGLMVDGERVFTSADNVAVQL